MSVGPQAPRRGVTRSRAIRLSQPSPLITRKHVQHDAALVAKHSHAQALLLQAYCDFGLRSGRLVDQTA